MVKYLGVKIYQASHEPFVGKFPVSPTQVLTEVWRGFALRRKSASRRLYLIEVF
jgi:hypothetical protein